MKIVFMGSPAFAVPSLKALVAAGHEIVAIYTQPPRPKGRGQQVQPTDVQLAAEGMGLGDKVGSPARLRNEALDEVLAVECDVVCVVAYGLLLPKVLVDNKVCLNVHPSALPRWRGAAPLQWTLLAGDTASEVCIMRLDEGMDTGPVYERVELPVFEDDTYGTLHDRAAELGSVALVDVLKQVDTLKPMAQEGETTHARKIEKEDRTVDFSQSARTVHNRIRALTPTPGAVMEMGGDMVKIRSSRVVEGNGNPGDTLRVEDGGKVFACAEGAVWIGEVLMPGGGWKPAA